MPNPSSLTLAKSRILEYFAKAGPAAYSEADFATILELKRQGWAIVKSTTARDFIAFLQKHGLKTYSFRAEAYGRTITRYAWSGVSPYTLALALRSRGYISHGAAAYLHQLIKPQPKTIYLNVEQSPKPDPAGNLTQEALNRAFARPQRQSNYVFTHQSTSVTIIAGKNTDRLGVESITAPNGESLQMTNLERTLIDITVRPAYAGGIPTVLGAYRAARGRLTVDRLLESLDALDYVYPYHQAVGFLLQAAGYETADLSKIARRISGYDFYLAHDLIQPHYSAPWRVYHPRDLKLPRAMRPK